MSPNPSEMERATESVQPANEDQGRKQVEMEMAALTSIINTLEPFGDEQRMRIMQTVAIFYNKDGTLGEKKPR